MQCPVCDVPLKMSERQGIEIDYCPQCRGVWLDRGELDKIIERTTAFEAQVNVAQSNPSTQPATFADANTIKQKRGYGKVEQDDDDDDDEKYDRRREKDYPRSKKRKSILSEIFDIFD
ncbi:MAG: zf-TFIIB domain-containing protein [Aggregatilineales bacterium]